MRKFSAALKEQGSRLGAQNPGDGPARRPSRFPRSNHRRSTAIPFDVGSCLWRGSTKVPAPWFHGIPMTAPSIVPPFVLAVRASVFQTSEGTGVRQIPYSENQ